MSSRLPIPAAHIRSELERRSLPAANSINTPIHDLAHERPSSTLSTHTTDAMSRKLPTRARHSTPLALQIAEVPSRPVSAISVRARSSLGASNVLNRATTPTPGRDKALPSAPFAQVVDPNSPPKAVRTLVDAEAGTPSGEDWPILQPENVTPVKAYSYTSSLRAGQYRSASSGISSQHAPDLSDAGSRKILITTPEALSQYKSLTEMIEATPAAAEKEDDEFHAVSTAKNIALESPLARKSNIARSAIDVPPRFSSKRPSLPLPKRRDTRPTNVLRPLQLVIANQRSSPVVKEHEEQEGPAEASRLSEISSVAVDARLSNTTKGRASNANVADPVAVKSGHAEEAVIADIPATPAGRSDAKPTLTIDTGVSNAYSTDDVAVKGGQSSTTSVRITPIRNMQPSRDTSSFSLSPSTSPAARSLYASSVREITPILSPTPRYMNGRPHNKTARILGLDTSTSPPDAEQKSLERKESEEIQPIPPANAVDPSIDNMKSADTASHHDSSEQLAAAEGDKLVPPTTPKSSPTPVWIFEKAPMLPPGEVTQLHNSIAARKAAKAAATVPATITEKVKAKRSLRNLFQKHTGKPAAAASSSRSTNYLPSFMRGTKSSRAKHQRESEVTVTEAEPVDHVALERQSTLEQLNRGVEEVANPVEVLLGQLKNMNPQSAEVDFGLKVAEAVVSAHEAANQAMFYAEKAREAAKEAETLQEEMLQATRM